MNANGYFQLVFYFAVLLLLAKPLGIYMAEVYEGRSAALRFGRPLERLLYRVSGIDPEKEMRWTQYALASLWFTLAGLVVVYALQRLQVWLPLNPQIMAADWAASSLNTTVRFETKHTLHGLVRAAPQALTLSRQCVL